MEENRKRRIKFAIAGYGHIGRRHAAEILAHKDASLAAVVEINPDTAKMAADLYQVPVYKDLYELFEGQQDLDIVTICTPNGLHIPMAIQAVEAGRHVLVEKPLGLYKKDCDLLLASAHKKQKDVFCVLQNRYSPPSRLINEIVREKKLGKIYWVSVSCYWNRDERYYEPGGWRGTKTLDGGPLYTQFSHFIDLLIWNFGRLRNIEARFLNNNHPYTADLEDTGTINFDLEHGGAGQFSYSTSVFHANMESSITIIGEKGSLKAGGQYMEKIEYFNIDGMTMPDLENTNPPNDYGAFKGSAANHAYVIDNIVRALNGEPYEMARAEEAVASVEMIEEIYKLRTLKF